MLSARSNAVASLSRASGAATTFVSTQENRSRRTTVPVHAGQTLKLGTMRSILAQAKLTEEEFLRLL